MFTVLGAPLDIPIIPWPMTGRCVMPNALVNPKLPWLLMPPRNPLDELTDGAAGLRADNSNLVREGVDDRADYVAKLRTLAERFPDSPAAKQS